MALNQPNIIMISCDHLRADFMGCSGHELIQTPHIDRLARKGIRFTQAYSTTPICVPARGMIMTGLEGHDLGLTTYHEGFPVKETLPQQLHDAGYQTLAVGKMHVYPERCHYGFDNMILWEEGRQIGKPYGMNKGYGDYEQWLAEQGYPGMAFTHGMSINEYSMTPWNLPDYLHPTEWIGYQACKEIKRRDWTRPLYMWASFTAPHPPLVPLMKDLYLYDRDDMPSPVIGDWADKHPAFHQLELSFDEQMTDKQIDLAYRAYFALVTQVDRQINRIIGTLREEGMLENTWFVFTSDHGDNLGDHHLWQKSNFLNGSCHIPLIITPPLRAEGDQLDELLGPNWVPGKVNNSVVGLQDILPTLCDIAGAEIPDHVNGKSLLPLVKDPTDRVRDTILGEYGNTGRRSLMLTNSEWKYIWYEEDGFELLFNILDDPNETRNLASKELNILEKWRNRLIDILSRRENDPAVSGKPLAGSSIGYELSLIEKEKRINTYPYYHPMGLR
ncbi:sulfatase-like hydrolase/transferase [Scopulibacillus cellulosilyticus]|uniref:Sulfatase-like hydrolase/transferase n=1 Tax=Scopulibacillus cellulosilyticus TaxID=2665665 RepID=A0ABW2PRW9_9BACL